jgi:transposase
MPARGRAAITTAALSEVDKSAWCRAQGIYPAELEQQYASATTALAEAQDA